MGVPEIDCKFVKDCLDANELGDGMLFAHLHQGQFVYVASADEWYAWVGHHWERDVKERSASAVENVAVQYLAAADDLREIIRQAEAGGEKDKAAALKEIRKKYIKRAEKLRSDRGIRSTLRFARIGEHALAIHGEELDQKPWLLACNNGVVNLKNGQLRDGRPEDYLTMACPHDYKGLDHLDERWEKFLLQISNEREELVDYYQRILGYAITGLSTVPDFFALAGQGRNGKSVLIETIAHVLGDLAGPIPAEMLLDQPSSRSANAASPDIMKLRGLRIAYASETDEGRKFSSSRIKWLTGGDRLTGRHPHDKYSIDFTPTHTLFLLTNHKPRAAADDFAFWERCRLIWFELSFVKDREPRPDSNERPADSDLAATLQECAPAILSWLVNGCLRWQAEGTTPPPIVKEATAAYRQEQDIIQEWIDDCIEEDPYGSAPARELNQSWTQWYEANVGKRVPSQRWLGQQLGKRYTKRKASTGYVYDGIKVIHEFI